MWYPGSGVILDLLIPDLCPLSYFDVSIQVEYKLHSLYLNEFTMLGLLGSYLSVDSILIDYYLSKQ